MSVTWAIGIPGSGKTHLALCELTQLCRAKRLPAIVIDDARAGNFDAWPHARDVDDLLECVFGYGARLAYTPADPDEVDRICEAVEGTRGCAMLIDEAATFVTASKGRGGAIGKLMRRHRHARAHLWLTTQHYSGDVSAEARSCSPRLCVFRCEANTVLDALERDHNLDRRIVATLPRYHYLELFSGFDKDSRIST